MNSEIQKELREEVLSAGDPTFDELNDRFPLLDAVLRETLRVHPPILENHHEVRENALIPKSDVERLSIQFSGGRNN